MKNITPELRQWISQRVALGAPKDSLLEEIIGVGWPPELARFALNEPMFGRSLAEPPEIIQPSFQSQFRGDPNKSMPEIDTSSRRGEIDLGDRTAQVMMSMDFPRVVLLSGFLSKDECGAMIEAARPNLDRSKTVNPATGEDYVHQARTSSGASFQRGANQLLNRIEARIERLTNWPAENGEGMQILHYLPGAQYEPHHDHFDPNNDGYQKILERGGQRLATLLLYLNDPIRGGGTIFPETNFEIAAHQGCALFFSYREPSVAMRTLHGGSPVIEGEKWIATKWLREGEFK